MNWKLSLLILASLSILAACGTSRVSRETTEESNATPTAEATAVVGDSVTPTPAPTHAAADTAPSQSVPGGIQRGGTLVRLWSDPPTLDPHLTTDATSASVIVEVFGGLVTIEVEDYIPGRQNKLVISPDLAADWLLSPDGTVYTFNIRRDAKFHDGSPVTAHDFKWSMERAADPRTAAPVVDQYLGDILGVRQRLKGEASEVEGVKVLGDHTLEITTDSAKTYFLSKLTYPTAFVLNQANVEASPRRWSREPNGTGPFRLEEYVPGERLILARNDNYHLGPPHLDRVEFILSGGTSMLMYENDEVHLTGVGLADLERVQDPNEPLNAELIQSPPSFSTQYIGMNVNVPPFDDPKVRQALNYAIDRESIARDVYAGLIAPATGILPPGFPGFSENIRGYGFDPERARQLLAESKYADNIENFQPLILTTAGSFGASLSLDIEVIRQMWEENLGIEVEILRTEFATYLQDLIKRRFDMFEIGWIADYPDPENFLDLLFYSDSSNNHTAFNNPQVDRLLEQARVETDETARFRLYSQVEQAILDEAPWIPLWYSGDQYMLVKPYVHDYYLTPLIIPKLRFTYMTSTS